MTVHRLKYAADEYLAVRLAFYSHRTSIGEIDSGSKCRVHVVGRHPGGRCVSMRNRQHPLFYGLCKRIKRKSAASKERDAREYPLRERTNMVKKHTSTPFRTK